MEVRNNHKDWLIFSVPNHGKDLQEQLKKKATGLMAGVSDLILIKPNEVVFVEIKDEKGRQSDKQKEFQNKVELLGFRYILCRSLNDFLTTEKINL